MNIFSFAELSAFVAVGVFHFYFWVGAVLFLASLGFCSSFYDAVDFEQKIWTFTIALVFGVGAIYSFKQFPDLSDFLVIVDGLKEYLLVGFIYAISVFLACTGLFIFNLKSLIRQSIGERTIDEFFNDYRDLFASIYHYDPFEKFTYVSSILTEGQNKEVFCTGDNVKIIIKKTKFFWSMEVLGDMVMWPFAALILIKGPIVRRLVYAFDAIVNGIVESFVASSINTKK